MAEIRIPSAPAECQTQFDRWLEEARGRLAEARRGGTPSVIAAAAAAVRELEDSLEQWRRLP